MSKGNEDAMESGVAADVDNFQNEINESDKEEKKSDELRIVDKVTYILAIACVVLSLLAIATAPGNWRKNIIYAAFIISIFTSSVVTVQRYFLTKMDTLRGVMNDIRAEALRLQSENNELSRQNNELEKEAKKVQDIEKQLSDVCGAQGQNVNEFVSLVKENEGILKEIKENMKAQTMNDFMTVVLLSDRDEDFTIDPNEIGALIYRLESQAGVKINKELFKVELEKCNYSIQGVMELVKDIADDGKAIFTIEPKNQVKRVLKL